MLSLVTITYSGGHNFDFDSKLETLAGRGRSDSTMDFDTDRRSMMFDIEFDNIPQFRAVIAQEFPDFTFESEY